MECTGLCLNIKLYINKVTIQFYYLFGMTQMQVKITRTQSPINGPHSFVWAGVQHQYITMAKIFRFIHIVYAHSKHQPLGTEKNSKKVLSHRPNLQFRLHPQENVTTTQRTTGLLKKNQCYAGQTLDAQLTCFTVSSVENQNS